MISKIVNYIFNRKKEKVLLYGYTKSLLVYQESLHQEHLENITRLSPLIETLTQLIDSKLISGNGDHVTKNDVEIIIKALTNKYMAINNG